MKKYLALLIVVAMIATGLPFVAGCGPSEADQAKTYLTKVNPIYSKAEVALETARKAFDASFFSNTSDANSMKQEATRVKGDLEKAKKDFDKAKSDFEAVAEVAAAKDVSTALKNYFTDGQAYFNEVIASTNYIVEISTIDERLDAAYAKIEAAPEDNPIPVYKEGDAAVDAELANYKKITPPSTYTDFHAHRIATLEWLSTNGKQATAAAEAGDEAQLDSLNAAGTAKLEGAQGQEDADLKAIQTGSLSAMRKKTTDSKLAADSAISKLKSKYDIKL